MIQGNNQGDTTEYVEMGKAQYLMRKRKYQEALPLLLRLRQQRFQHYWSRPRRDLGHIRSICLCDVVEDTTDEIIAGNEEGQIIAINILKEELAWSQPPSLGKAIKMIQAGTKDRDKYDSIFACTGDEHVYVLNEHGRLVEERGLVLAGEHIVSLYINRQGKQPLAEMSEVLIASEEKHISIYDADLRTRMALFDTPDVVCVLSSHDLTGDNSSEIIAGTLTGSVYAYKRQGDTAVELWNYRTAGRIHALVSRDIDDDGGVEVIVGSDDGNVSILSKEGRLKWRYFTDSPVLEVSVSDIDQDGKSEILIGTGSGRMLVLTAEGDTRWTFQADGPITGIHTRDMDEDKVVEIAVSTSTQLDLLQVIDTRTLQDGLDLCMKKIRGFDDPKIPILELAASSDEYIRSYALMTIAGFHTHSDSDFELLFDALHDSSLEVRKGLSMAIINLGESLKDGDDAQGRQQLARLVEEVIDSPEQEIRLSLANLISKLVETDAELGFNSLKKFMGDGNLWVRHAAIRQLDKLVSSYPRQTFPLLREAVRSGDEWMSLEGCRSLAHYFDRYSDDLADETYTFLRTPIEPLILQQIANNAGKPLVRAFFGRLAALLSSEPAQVAALDERDNVFRRILQARTLTDADIPENQYRGIVQQSRSIRSAHAHDTQALNNRHLRVMIDVLHSLKQERSSDEDLLRLNSAVGSLDALIREVQAMELQEQDAAVLAQRVLLLLLLQRLYDLVKAALRRIEGQAKIVPEFRTRLAQQGKQYEVSIRISNQGSRPAKNVRVILELANSDEFEIVGSNEQFLGTVSTDPPLSASFTITLKKLDVETLRLSFIIIYDDIGRLNRKIFFTDKVSSKSAFQEISNPYNSGKPVRDKAMFFDRIEIRQRLHELLLDPQRKEIVLLYGPRKSGKTSLIYQLVAEVAKSQTSIPVFLDVQALPLGFSDSKRSRDYAYDMQDILSEMFSSFAYDILNAVKNGVEEEFKKRGITASDFVQDFQHEPLLVFESFLKQIIDALGGRGLILFIDEFDVLEQVIKNNAAPSYGAALSTRLIQSLIAAMKHVEGVRFLLAGGSQMRNAPAFKDGVVAYRLSELESEGARQLITSPIKAPFLEYDAHALSRIQKLTNNQPYLIQLLCETIVRHCNKQGIDYVDDRHVANAVDAILDGDINYLTWTWKYLSKQERSLLSFVAQEQRTDEESVSIRDINPDELGLERVDLRQLLMSLQEQGILKKEDADHFKIAADLMREWRRRKDHMKR